MEHKNVVIFQDYFCVWKFTSNNAEPETEI